MIIRSRVMGLSKIRQVNKDDKKYSFRDVHCDVSSYLATGSSSLPARVYNDRCEKFSVGDDVVISLDRYGSQILDIVSLDVLL